MKEKSGVFRSESSNRRVLSAGNGAVAAGAATLGAGLVTGKAFAFDRGHDQEDNGPGITRGDIAILTFLQALEQVEADLWQQYSELGGTQDNEVSGLNGVETRHTHRPWAASGWGHAARSISTTTATTKTLHVKASWAITWNQKWSASHADL